MRQSINQSINQSGKLGLILLLVIFLFSCNINLASDSKVFIANRTLTIPTLLVCDHEVTQAEYKAVMESNLWL